MSLGSLFGNGRNNNDDGGILLLVVLLLLLGNNRNTYVYDCGDANCCDECGYNNGVGGDWIWLIIILLLFGGLGSNGYAHCSACANGTA